MESRLLTNGMLVKPDIAKRIVELGVEKVTISVDGPEKVHNTIRKNPLAFKKLIEAVKNIQAEKDKQKSRLPYLSFANTISASNAGTMSELMDVAGQYGVNVGFSYMYYVSDEMEKKTAEILQVESAKGEDYRMPEALKLIDPEVIRQQMAEVAEKERQYNIKAGFFPPLTPEEAKLRYTDDRQAYAEKCFYVWNHARINPYGDVYACGPISISMGNVAEQPLKQIWNNDEFKKFRVALRDRRLFPKCAKCCALSNTAWKYLPVVHA
jgi:radical SAM protein with 4Fe4S-binding SPASM domain